MNWNVGSKKEWRLQGKEEWHVLRFHNRWTNILLRSKRISSQVSMILHMDLLLWKVTQNLRKQSNSLVEACKCYMCDLNKNMLLLLFGWKSPKKKKNQNQNHPWLHSLLSIIYDQEFAAGIYNLGDEWCTVDGIRDWLSEKPGSQLHMALPVLLV